MNQYEESGEEDQSEDGQWRSPDDEISHEDDEGDTADSLDIKPPQARIEMRFKEKKSSKEKKHSRERKHKERERIEKEENRRHKHRAVVSNEQRDEKYDGFTGGSSGRKGDREMIRYEQQRDQHYRQGHKDRPHDKIRERDKDKRVKRKDNLDKSDADKILEDLRSRLLSKRNKYESEKHTDDRIPPAIEYENRRIERYEYENRREKETERRAEHYYREYQREYQRERKPAVEFIHSPENYSDTIPPSHQDLPHKEKERRAITAEDKEHVARRAKLLEAEREMARQKKLAREELEARREMRREREVIRHDSSTSPEEVKKRASAVDDEDKKKFKVGDIVTVSDNTEEDDDTDTDSSTSHTDEEDDEQAKIGKHESETEVTSPLSIGELSKSDLRRQNNIERSRSRSNTRSRSGSPNDDTKSRSRSTSKSLTPRSRSRSPPNRSKSKSPMDTYDDDDDQMEGIEPKNIDDNPIAKIEEIKEVKDELPPYFPAIQGCRSVEEFQCLNRIEEGTYGVVYRAKDKRTEEIVALKRLKMEKEKEGFPITSLREINTLLKGQHPNIVTVREIVVGSNMDKIFIVMDYVEHDLKSLMETMKHKKQVFLPGEVKCLTQQLLKAVAHLHDNWILHRDLKTSNLLLSHKGILKVGDFGLAREYGSPLKAYTSIVVTLWYRAPELLLCCKEYSIPIDMWSVGCIFAEFLAMTALFPGKSEVDQLNRIFKDLGTPNERIWPGYNELPAVQKMSFTEYPVSNLRKKFSHLTSEIGLSLLQGLLTYDPKQRFSAEHALKSSYFKELPLPIDPAMFPTWPAKSELGLWKPSASPKPPSGGSEFKNLGADDGDQRWGASLMESRQLAMGPGFSLKF